MHLIRWFYPFMNGLGLGVIAMLLHECGHIAAAMALGVRVKNVGIKLNKGLYTVREQGNDHQNHAHRHRGTIRKSASRSRRPLASLVQPGKLLLCAG